MGAEFPGKKTYLGDNPDGTPHFLHEWPGLNADGETHALMLTGQMRGDVTLSDGTTYNVTNHTIGVRLEHADELTGLISAFHRDLYEMDAPVVASTQAVSSEVLASAPPEVPQAPPSA